MKKFFLSLVIFCLWHSSLSASMESFASKELVEAQQEYAQVLKNTEQQMQAKRAILQDVYAQIQKAQTEIGLLEKQIKALENLKEKKAFYTNLCRQLRSELPEDKNVQSASEIYSAVEREFTDKYNDLKNPLRLVKTEAVDAKTKEKIYGDSFRIGAQKYFVSASKAGFLSDDGRFYGGENSDSILNFTLGKKSSVRFDSSFGALLKRQSENLTFVDKVKKGGVWIFPILFLGVISILVFCFKIVQLTFVGRIEKVASKTSAQSLQYPFNELAFVIDSAQTKEDAEELVFEAIVRVGAKLRRWISVLSITSAVSPLFGLLGTVSGIIKTLSDLSTQSGQAKELSSGIAEALITTEYGLIVAIPALIASSVLSCKIKRILEEAERFSTERILRKKWAEK